jgi:hypothetical protein
MRAPVGESEKTGETTQSEIEATQPEIEGWRAPLAWLLVVMSRPKALIGTAVALYLADAIIGIPVFLFLAAVGAAGVVTAAVMYWRNSE